MIGKLTSVKLIMGEDEYKNYVSIKHDLMLKLGREVTDSEVIIDAMKLQ